LTKTELKKLKELDAFLRERNMELRASNILVGFNVHKYYRKDKYVHLDLNVGFTISGDSNIVELNDKPTIKNHYYIQKGRLKQY
jgi:hypothetical protein